MGKKSNLEKIVNETITYCGYILYGITGYYEYQTGKLKEAILLESNAIVMDNRNFPTLI